MKLIYVLSLLIGLTWATPISENIDILPKVDLQELHRQLQNRTVGGKFVGADGQITAIVNDYADKIFGNLQNMMIHDGFDPLTMQDINEKISYTLLFVTFWGELNLTKGWLQDASTIRRDGDVVVLYSTETEKMDIVIPMTFSNLGIVYDYYIAIMGLGPSGGVIGSVTDLRMKISITIDYNTYLASVKDYTLVNSGHLSVHFDGNILVDWLINLATNVTTTVLKPIILLIVENIVQGTLESLMDVINRLVGSILNPDGLSTVIRANIPEYYGILANSP